MQFVFLDDELKTKYRQKLLEIVKLCDNEFIPPLSQRTSTTQKTLLPNNCESEGVYNYFNQMMQQDLLCAIDNDKILGVVSYKQNFANEEISKTSFPNIYISTVMIEPSARGKKLTSFMYEHLFNDLYPNHNFFTRTWSTNFAHIKILTNFGFEQLKVIKNDRGNSIDTIYFMKLNLATK